MTSEIIGFKELSAKLNKMTPVMAGKFIRSAALSAMLPALRAAQAGAPVGNPPYGSKDPYPVKGYKGMLRTPGNARRSVARKTRISRGGVIAMLGVKPEAFYALNFHEFGTSKIPKKPWLEPAFRSTLPALDSTFRQKLKAIIDKAAK